MVKINSRITYSAPGKIIISGEHAVVYGYCALAAAINRRIYLTINKNSWAIRSEIPPKCGLGSSAARSVVVAAALAGSPDKDTINQIAFALEKIHHGTPSGVDNTVAVYGGIMLFAKGKPARQLKFRKLPKFLLVNTGKPAEGTKEMVEKIKSKVKSQKSKITKILANIGKLPEEFVRVFRLNDLTSLSHLIEENERLLEKLGVVGEKAQKIISRIEGLGGAAKICGAGGVRKGSGIALVYHQNLKIIEKYCLKNKLPFFSVKLGEEGLRVEK